MIRQLIWGVVFIAVSFGLLQGDLYSRKRLANTRLMAVVPTSRATLAVEGTSTAAMVPYPEGYRAWAHVKSALVSSRHPDFENTGGFRHIYANTQAMAGYRSGTFPDGSIIVVDWLEGRDENGMFTEGVQRRLDVMVKNSARFAATGGWGFERFQGASHTERTVTSAAKECFACHSGQGARDMVFSKLRK